jgi:hypothetical protein
VGKVANPNDMVLWQKAAARKQKVGAAPSPAALCCIFLLALLAAAATPLGSCCFEKCVGLPGVF